MKFFLWIIEIVNWFKIMLSPLFLGLFFGGLFYLYKPDATGIFFGCFIALIGLVCGIILATYISRKKGATEFNAILNSTPDFDVYDEKKINENDKENDK